MKKIKIPCSFQTISTPSEDKRLVKCSIKVQHDKENLNGSYFDKADIEKCSLSSLRMTPILGSIIFDEDSEEYRLNGHDMEYKIVKNEDGYDLKVHHIERIYGMVSPDAEIYFEYDEEKDKHYLMTEGYLWKNYMDELEDVLNKKDGQTQVSMEISANDFFEREDGLTQITDYTYEGITLLGVQEAMVGANLQLFSEDTMSKLKASMEELVQVYSLEKEEDTLEDNKENVIDEPKQEFGLSVQNITDQIFTRLGERVIEVEDYWGDKYKTREFYFIDVLPNEQITIVEKSNCSGREYVGIPYSLNEDVVALDYDNAKSYIQEWREMSGDVEPKVYSVEDVEFKEHIMNKFNSIDTHEKELEELETIKNSYSELVAKVEEMKDYEELKEFKQSYDKAQYEVEIKEITSKFELEVEDYQELQEKALNGEIAKEQYEKELYCILGMKQMSNKFNFTKVEKSTHEVKVKIENKTSSVYGELGKKYSK